MKKIIAPLLLLLIALNGCSSSDDNNNEELPIGPLVATSTMQAMGPPASYTWTYSGNKLLAIENSDYSEQYTYTGDLITKIEFYDGTTLDNTELFEYNADGKVVLQKKVYDSYAYKYTYAFNPDGSITTASFTGDVNVQDTTAIYRHDLFYQWRSE